VLLDIDLIDQQIQPIRQTVPHDPVGKIQFTHIIFRTKFLKMKIIAFSFMCVRLLTDLLMDSDISNVGAI